MKISRMLVAASCAVLLLGGTPAAFAQRGGGGHGGGGGGFHGGGMGISHGGGGFRGGGMRVSRGGRIVGTRPVIRTRGFGGVHSRPFINGGFGRSGSPFIPHGRFVRGGFVHGGNVVHGRAFVHRRGFVGPVHFFRPYYAFHPRVRIGFGLWGGYPFAYPYAFYYPYYPSYYYPYVPSYPYAPNGYVRSDATSGTSGSLAQPSETNLGGLSFEITPSNAELFVDNMRVGTVGDFTPTTQPLGVEAGHHHVEIRAPGYQTMSFDVDITAGQVIPYQGSLER
jgi:hypothetical protein